VRVLRGHRLRKLGEDVTRTLESQAPSVEVIETVREKFTCRDCEKVTQRARALPAIARGNGGTEPAAMIVFESSASTSLDRQPTLRLGRRADRAVDHGGRRGDRSARPLARRSFAWWRPMC